MSQKSNQSPVISRHKRGEKSGEFSLLFLFSAKLFQKSVALRIELLNKPQKRRQMETIVKKGIEIGLSAKEIAGMLRMDIARIEEVIRKIQTK